MTKRINYRKLALEKYPPVCAHCGFGIVDVLEVCHIDCQRTNNDVTNLVILCPTCHKMHDLDLISTETIVNIIVPSQASLENSQETEVYMVDVPKLSPEQFHGVADRLAKQSGEPVWDVRREMMARGLPLRASQCRGVATDQLWWFL